MFHVVKTVAFQPIGLVCITRKEQKLFSNSTIAVKEFLIPAHSFMCVFIMIPCFCMSTCTADLCSRLRYESANMIH